MTNKEYSQEWFENNLDSIFYNLQLVGIAREVATHEEILWSADECYSWGI